MAGLAHCVSLQGAAGVELQFAEFVRVAAQRHPQWTHDWLNCARAIDPDVRRLLPDGSIRRTLRTKYWRAVKLPSWPAGIRRWNCRRFLARAGIDTVVVWNRSARLNSLLAAADPDRCIHYEHGAAWFPGREAERRAYFRSVPRALANSRAAAAVLQQVWDYRGAIAVCTNALRPSLVPRDARTKRLPSSRRIRLGLAARLFPVKGAALVIHAVHRLRERHVDAELHVAGAGPERANLERLTAHLGLGERVRFHGLVTDMGAFYRSVDCLIHAPISEAFGLVAIEAAAHGCPAIVAAVDGLPEAVSHGVSGLCVEPKLPLSDYVRLGGTAENLPPQVYDPGSGRISAARIVDPGDLADAALRLFSESGRFEALSGTAIDYVATAHAFDRHVDAVMAAISAASAE